jgi:uncharacterized membrane protein HdeD (DUF308 family)
LTFSDEKLIFTGRKEQAVFEGFTSMSGLIAGILSIVVGLIIIIWPRVIAFVVGAYLVIVGILAVITAL